MGKLLTGHYGEPPDAESVTISLRDCHQRCGLKPSDFVSVEPPDFFHKQRGARGKYLVFQVEPGEVQEAAVWRAGYYLLPLAAADVLKVFHKQEILLAGATQRPVEIEYTDQAPPADVLERARRWADQSQPLLFQCYCPQLVMRMESPSLLRRGWKLKLTCRKRCQPPVKTQI